MRARFHPSCSADNRLLASSGERARIGDLDLDYFDGEDQ